MDTVDCDEVPGYRERIRKDAIDDLRNGLWQWQVAEKYGVPVSWVRRANKRALSFDSAFTERCREFAADTARAIELLRSGIPYGQVAGMFDRPAKTIRKLAKDNGINMSRCHGFVYALECPIVRRVFYVGQSFDPWHRLLQHITRPTPQMRPFIRASRRRRLRPAMIVLERVENTSMIEREGFWIRAYRLAGHPLVNRTHELETA